MDQKLEQIQHLLSLFDDREIQQNAHNYEIARILSPGLLSAVLELLGLEDSAIAWTDFQVMDSVLVVGAQITYESSKERTPFMQAFAPASADTPDAQVVRTIRFGMPLTQLFLSKDEIKAELIKLTEKPAEDPKPEPAVIRFDATQLTDNQLEQMIYGHWVTKERLQ